MLIIIFYLLSLFLIKYKYVYNTLLPPSFFLFEISLKVFLTSSI